MATLVKENIVLRETDKGRIQELKLQGFEEVVETKKVESKKTTPAK